MMNDDRKNNVKHFWDIKTIYFTLIFDWYLLWFLTDIYFDFWLIFRILFSMPFILSNGAPFIIESETFHFIMLTEWQVSPTVTLHGAGDKSPLLCGLGKVDAWDGEEVLDGDEPPVHLSSLLSTDTASRLTLDSPTYKQTYKVSLHHRHRQNRHVWNSPTPFTWYFFR